MISASNKYLIWSSASTRPSRFKTMKHIKKILWKPFKKRGTPSENSAEFDRDSRDTKSNHGEGSQIASISTLTARHDGGSATSLQGRGRTQMGSVEAQDGRNAPDAKSAERDPKHASGAGQDGGDTHDVEQVQSRKSRVKKRGWITQVVDRLVVTIDPAKVPAQGFAPLKAVLESISVFYAKYQDTVAVEDRIEILCSRITTLVNLFEKPAGNEEEKERRMNLLIKLKDIEEESGSLREKSVPLRYLDSAQDSKVVSGLVNDLQEAVNDYMMAQQMSIYDQGCQLIDAGQNVRCSGRRGSDMKP
ncbi:hypothetical protein AX14_001431 [Amanita brunnescens Koide BX004]|nr:hypothetical protein AX14_001431 [Amanita brunnescens Koide BX004]